MKEVECLWPYYVDITTLDHFQVTTQFFWKTNVTWFLLPWRVMGRDLASDPATCLFSTGNCHLRWAKKCQFWTILHYFRPFWAISDHFEQALLLKTTGNFEILAKSMVMGLKTTAVLNMSENIKGKQLLSCVFACWFYCLIGQHNI